MPSERYPKIAIKSKNDLAKRISHKKLSQQDALYLINDVLDNFDKYWKDAPEPLSEPNNNKYVRNAKRTPLGKLLKLIDRNILQPHDTMVPHFIFGGVKNKDHVKAAKNLIGRKKYRTLLKSDLSRFYEHVPQERVVHFFMEKTQCSRAGARLLAKLCCVPKGPKGSQSNEMTIARGFATSSRLAVWCNLDFFLKLYWLVKEQLKEHDPRLSIYVDDIGITASRVTVEQMEQLYTKIRNIFNPEIGYSLPLNETKKKIKSYKEGMRILGTIILRNSLHVSDKTTSKIQSLKKKISKSKGRKEREKNKEKKNNLMIYKHYVESK